MKSDDQGLIFKALAFAAYKHRDQRRKDATASPYINHPIALANVLVNEGHVTDVEVICAALLHDTIEDTECSHEELAAEFGQTIADLVADVTLDMSKPKPERKIWEVEHAPHMLPKAQLVKLADKICNVRDVADGSPLGWSLERRLQYFDHAKAVVDGIRGVHPGLEAIFDEAMKMRPAV